MKTANLLSCLVVLIFASTHTAFCQTNYQPGSVKLLSDGQTRPGLIDYREWRLNPRKISFKKDETSEIIQYSVADLASFRIDGKDSFERAIVKKDMTPVDLRDLVDGRGDSTAIDTVFLRVLVKGSIVELYQLVDQKLHFYVKEGQDAFQELVYKVSYDNINANLQYKRTYRNQLHKFVIGHKEEKKLLGYLERANYNERELVKIVTLINELKVEKKKGSLTNFYIAGGPAFSSLKITGSTEASQLTYSVKAGFTGGLGIDIASSRNLQDLIFRFELFYTSLSYEGKGFIAENLPNGANATYTIKQNNFTPSVALLYSVLRKPSWKVYLGAGLNCNFTSYPENKYVKEWVNYDKKSETKDYFHLESNWLVVDGRVGGIVANRFEIAGSVNILGSFNRAMGIAIKPSIYTLKVGYRFKKSI